MKDSDAADFDERDEPIVEDDFGFGLRTENLDPGASLIWASVGPQSPEAGVWMGLGLLSDNGLPFCALHQFLAAKVQSPAHKAIDVLLADVHAVSDGESPEVVARRADVRRADLLAIEKLLGVRFNIMLASEIAQKPRHRHELERVRAWIATNGLNLSEYSILGIADDLYFSQEKKLKIGWSREREVREGRGGHHEAETDLIARRIEPEVGACYVRHGVRLDSNRPTGVPYTELQSTSDRLMLTGQDCGGFNRKLSDQQISRHRRTAVIDHLAIAVSAFENLVMPLEGDVIAKAEAIQQRLVELLQENITLRRTGAHQHGESNDCGSSINIIDTLQARGLIHQSTDLDRLREHLAQPRRIYCGFDPTASSLTIGNLVPLIVLRHLQRAGHTPVVVLGGGTGLIGDPSGKAAERQLLSEGDIQSNLRSQRSIFEAILDSRYETPNRALYFDNAEWLSDLNFLKALRDIGKHFSVNQLIQRDSIRDRMARQQGISVTEFLYCTLQAWDFKVLFEESQVTVQLGGADQWTNIISGVDLVRRLNQKTVYGLTCPLVTRADGGKFGKTETGPIWLTADRTSPYQLFQFFMNQPDEDVGRFLRLFTFLPLSKIEEIEHSQKGNPTERLAQRALAREVIALIHGTEAAQDAENAAEAFFRGNVATLPAKTLTDALSAAPTTHHPLTDLARPISTVELLCLTTACSSKREARELLTNGAITVNGKKVNQSDYFTSADLLHGKFAAVRRGRKHWFVGVWE